jgi:5-methylcytosine-specific restriction endonuclease McrA
MQGAPLAPTAAVPLERLEAQICELAGHLTAATARFLALVADFDARRGFESWSLASTAVWLAWKCQLAPGTAREHVRVARALRELPVIGGEFAAGRLSYAKVRALTRIATPETDAGLAELAEPMTAGQLDRFARAHRKVSAVDDQRARRRRGITWRLEDDGSLAMSVRLPAAEGQVVLKALRAAADDLEHPHRRHRDEDDAEAKDRVPAGTRAADPPKSGPAQTEDDVPAGTPAARSIQRQPTPSDPAAASLADALVGMAADYLAGKIVAASNSDIYQVIVHVGPDALTADPAHDQPADCAQDRPAEADADAGSCRADCLYRRVGHPAGSRRRCHLDDGPAISMAAAQRLACAATVTWMLHDHNGTLLDVGRRHRRPSPALRRAVRERDKGRCQFPGCHSRRTDIHHIRHWARGGKTRLRNLISLCEAHHVIVHELGHLITQTSDGTFAFTRPDGTPMPASPPLSAPEGDISAVHDAVITAATVDTSYYGDRFDLDLAIWAVFANARVARERADRAAAR